MDLCSGKIEFFAVKKRNFLLQMQHLAEGKWKYAVLYLSYF